MAELPLPITSLLPLRLDNTLGVILISDVLVAMLFGITSVQIYIYYQRSPRDSRFMKYIIFFLWVVDGLHLVLTTHGVYDYTVNNYMNPLALTKIPWSFSVDVACGDLLEIIVTAMFSYRIWKLGGKTWPLFFILPPALLGLAGSIGISVLTYPVYADFTERYAWLWYATFSVQAFSDCAISVTLCAMLVVRRTGFRKTDSLIRVLVLYSINTCALTSSVAVASIITYAAMPHNFIFMAFAMVLPKLILNSLLALLNSRDVMRDMYNGQPVSIHFSKFATPDNPSDVQMGKLVNQVEAIELKHTDQSFHSDGVDCTA